MTKFLKAAEGLKVFLPSKGRNILPNGENVNVDAYIEGRLKCGSLVEADAPKAKTKNSKETEE